jgi:hypothetical protein
MKFLRRPTEKIRDDAWYIADSMIRVADSKIFLSRSTSPYKIKMYTEAIERSQNICVDRLDRWATEHTGSWTQYLDGHPNYNQIQKILEGR